MARDVFCAGITPEDVERASSLLKDSGGQAAKPETGGHRPHHQRSPQLQRRRQVRPPPAHARRSKAPPKSGGGLGAGGAEVSRPPGTQEEAQGRRNRRQQNGPSSSSETPTTAPPVCSRRVGAEPWSERAPHYSPSPGSETVPKPRAFIKRPARDDHGRPLRPSIFAGQRPVPVYLRPTTMGGSGHEALPIAGGEV